VTNGSTFRDGGSTPFHDIWGSGPGATKGCFGGVSVAPPAISSGFDRGDWAAAGQAVVATADTTRPSVIQILANGFIGCSFSMVLALQKDGMPDVRPASAPSLTAQSALSYSHSAPSFEGSQGIRRDGEQAE
jgi:hypothetical protein